MMNAMNKTGSMNIFSRFHRLWISIGIILVLYFCFVGFWTGFYTKRKIIHDIQRSTGLVVSIGYSHIYPFTGNGTMKNIELRNPAGFISKSALSIQEVKFSGNVKSLYAEEIHLNTMELNGIELHVEYRGGQTNLSKLAMSASEAHSRFYSSSEVGFKTIRLNQLNLDEFLIQLGPRILNLEPPVLKLKPVALESIGFEAEGSTLRQLGIRLAKIYLEDAETQLQHPPVGINENIAQELKTYIAIAKQYLN